MSLKTKVRFSSTLDIHLNQQLKAYSERTGIPISKILEFALKQYLKEVAKK